MPVFEQLELFLDSTYSKDQQKSFIFKSRFICNFVERALREKKFETTYSRVNIHCSRERGMSSATPLKGAPYLEVRISHEIQDVEQMTEALLHRELTKVIDEGLRVAETRMEVPRRFCLRTLEEFAEVGFKNEWTQAEKQWPKVAAECVVTARLTMEKFSLLQRVWIDERPVVEETIVETKPREMLFLDYLGTLAQDRERNIVYKRARRTLTKFDLATKAFVAGAGELI